jgi:Rix1 complex component involved in 60S ribosome maturation
MTHTGPLILDTSSSVRSELINLLRDLFPTLISKEPLQAHIPMLALYIQSAMTHIRPDIRKDSTKFLTWLLNIGALQIVRGSWSKLVSSFAGLLGWVLDGPEKLSVQLVRGSTLSAPIETTARHVQSLHDFLVAGLREKSSDVQLGIRPETIMYTSQSSFCPQHPLMHCYLLPSSSSAFAHLNLFSAAPVESQLLFHDVASRRKHFSAYVKPLLMYLHDVATQYKPLSLSRQPNHTVIDDLYCTIIRLLGLIMEVYIDRHGDDQPKKSWDALWTKCVKRVSDIVDMGEGVKGTRRLQREWELSNIDV